MLLLVINKIHISFFTTVPIIICSTKNGQIKCFSEQTKKQFLAKSFVDKFIKKRIFSIWVTIISYLSYATEVHIITTDAL